MKQRPEAGEYTPYYIDYINPVPDGDIVKTLKYEVEETIELVNHLTEKQTQFKYAPNKWTIKEVLGHMADTERIMSYRILCIARGDALPLPGFEEDLYVQNASFNNQSLVELLEQLRSVRQSTVSLLKGLNQEAWLRRGIANHADVTVRAIAWIIAGHERHHREILQERYMKAEDFPN